MNRDTFFKIWTILLLVLVLLPMHAEISWAKYPERPISFIVPLAPGGGVDMSARPLVAAAKSVLGQPIYVENYAGGSGAVGLGILKNRKADGYSLGVTTQSSLVTQYLHKVPYNFVKDFTHIMQYVDVNIGIIVPDTSPWKTLKELIDYTKANPGKIRYSSAGPGSQGALGMASLAKHLQLDWSHIPFESTVAALSALLGGHVEVYPATMSAKPHILSGKVRMLAYFGEKRSRTFPNVPTLLELGIPVVASNFYNIIGPRGLNSEIVDKVHQAFKNGMQDPDFIKICDSLDLVINYRSPQDTVSYVLKQDEEVRKILQHLKVLKQ